MPKISYVCVDERRRSGQKRVGLDVLYALSFYSDDVKKFSFTPGISLQNLLLWPVMLFSIIFRGRENHFVYLVCSRSVLGFIRDLPFLLLSFVGFRVIVHVHGADIFKLFEGKAGGLAQFAYKNAETIYPTGLGAVQLEKYSSVSHVLSAFTTSRPEDDKRSGEFTIVWNTHVCFSKGIKLVLEACNTLYLKGYQFKFLCFGEVISDFMASMQECDDFVSSFDQAPWFVRVGGCPEFVVQSALKRSSCNLLVSRYPSESQGLSAVDAVASGIPVILSDLACFHTFRGCPSVTIIEPKIDDLTEALENNMIKFHKNPAVYFDEALDTLSMIGDELSCDNFYQNLQAIINDGARDGY